MTKHRLEVADVFREYGLQFLAQYGNSLSIDQKRAFRRGELQFHGRLAMLANLADFEQYLNKATRKDWVVDARRPFGSAERVLKYLARYVNRVAISNRRLQDMKDGKVRFRYKDYADSGKQKVMTLDATEFIRRFLLHVLPNGFMHIRHYGFLANRFRQRKLALCRQLLGVGEDAGDADTETLQVEPADIEAN